MLTLSVKISSKMYRVVEKKRQKGFTVIELLIGMLVLGIVSTSIITLYAVMTGSAVLSKRKAQALTLATNQMEYIKSLPYNSINTTTVTASTTTTINNYTYTIQTSINYVDNAYDGCFNYPTVALKNLYCRDLPAPATAPAVDTNPQDYKVINVKVRGQQNLLLSEVDTQISARVAETASNTGALFVTVIDSNGNPVSGATIQVTNTTVSPNVNVSDSSDSNGVAIFYGLTPDTTGYDYIISASKSGYSSLSTIGPSGLLQATYQSQQIFTQLSSQVTLTLKPQATYSLIIESTDLNGNPIANVKPYIKGGYKRYTDTANTAYYYDTMSPSDTRPTTDASGLTTLSNLVPGPYYFCGDAGATSCSVGGTTYYLAAAVPYLGNSLFEPINIPSNDISIPTISYSGNNFVQKARLILTTSAAHPRITTFSPAEASLATGLSAFTFQISGVNLPCDAVATSCATTVRLIQASNTYTASCTGSDSGVLLNCTVDLSTAAVGATQLEIVSGGYTFTLPGSPLLGGINVVN